MKNFMFFIAGILIFILTVSGCSKNETISSEDIQVLKMNMKGWELYSWPAGKSWNYSILPGTNRLKNYDEVVSLIIYDLESLKDSLDNYGKNEEFFWIGRGWLERSWMTGYGDLGLPDAATIKEVKDYCDKKGLQLTIND